MKIQLRIEGNRIFNIPRLVSRACPKRFHSHSSGREHKEQFQPFPSNEAGRFRNRGSGLGLHIVSVSSRHQEGNSSRGKGNPKSVTVATGKDIRMKGSETGKLPGFR